MPVEKEHSGRVRDGSTVDVASVVKAAGHRVRVAAWQRIKLKPRVDRHVVIVDVIDHIPRFIKLGVDREGSEIDREGIVVDEIRRINGWQWIGRNRVVEHGIVLVSVHRRVPGARQKYNQQAAQNPPCDGSTQIIDRAVYVIQAVHWMIIG